MGDKIINNKVPSPLIIFEGSYSTENIQNFKKKYKISQTIDIYKNQLEELFEITYPSNKFSSNYQQKLNQYIIENNFPIKGNWIYFPWNETLIHCLREEDYNLLRTNRNKNLITEEEQKILLDSCIGIIGLSIGSHFAASFAYNGIANSLKLADFDSLSTSNLNRIRAGIKDIGIPKIQLISQQIYEINPYAKLHLFDNGLNDALLYDFIHKNKKLDIVFEAIDDFKMKIKIRLEARKAKIPVVMLTNLGDSLLVDIERYDKNPQLPLFNGIIGNTPEEILESDLTEKDKVKFAIKIVGIENLSTRLLTSLFEINKTLVGRPQLYSTVTIGGGIAAYIARNILLNNRIESGRTLLSFDELLGIKKVFDKEVHDVLVKKIRENFDI